MNDIFYIKQVNPQSGWLDIQFDKFNIQISYLTDIGLDWLKQINFGLYNNVPFCLSCTDEENDYLIIINFDNIILYCSDKILYKIHIEFKIIIRHIFNELLKFKDELIIFPFWVNNIQKADKRKTELNFYYDKIGSFFLLNDL